MKVLFSLIFFVAFTSQVFSSLLPVKEDLPENGSQVPAEYAREFKEAQERYLCKEDSTSPFYPQIPCDKLPESKHLLG